MGMIMVTMMLPWNVGIIEEIVGRPSDDSSYASNDSATP